MATISNGIITFTLEESALIWIPIFIIGLLIMLWVLSLIEKCYIPFYETKPLKCKKCHKKLGLFSWCKHGQFTNYLIFFLAIYFPLSYAFIGVYWFPWEREVAEIEAIQINSMTNCYDLAYRASFENRASSTLAHSKYQKLGCGVNMDDVPQLRTKP